MAAITVTAANARAVNDPIDQWTAKPAVAILAGQCIRLNASGLWVLAQGDVAANATGVYIALRAADQHSNGLTGMRQGMFTGIDPTLAVNAPVFLSGAVAGGIDTVAAAVSVLVGRVMKPGIMKVDCPL